MGVDVAPINDGQSASGSLSGIGSSAVAIRVGSGNLLGRRGLYIKNTSDVVLKWGFTTITCVAPLAAETAAGKGDGGEIWIDVGEAQDIFILAVSGSGKTAAIAELR